MWSGSSSLRRQGVFLWGSCYNSRIKTCPRLLKTELKHLAHLYARSYHRQAASSFGCCIRVTKLFGRKAHYVKEIASIQKQDPPSAHGNLWTRCIWVNGLHGVSAHYSQNERQVLVKHQLKLTAAGKLTNHNPVIKVLEIHYWCLISIYREKITLIDLKSCQQKLLTMWELWWSISHLVFVTSRETMSRLLSKILVRTETIKLFAQILTITDYYY